MENLLKWLKWLQYKLDQTLAKIIIGKLGSLNLKLIQLFNLVRRTWRSKIKLNKQPKIKLNKQRKIF